MALIKDTAVVLRRLDYSETSQVMVLFTRAHGQLRVIAKGIKRATKKKASTGIDLLEMGDLVFAQRPGKEDVLATLTEWRQSETFTHLQRDLARLYAAQYAAEVTAQLTEPNDPHPALFDALTVMLRKLASDDPVTVLVRYLWIMLREIGLVPELSVCMRCGNGVAGDRVLYFSSRAGGAICRDCEPQSVEKRRVDSFAAALLCGLNGSNSSAMNARAVRHAFDLLDYHLTETMGKPARLKAPLLAALQTRERK